MLLNDVLIYGRFMGNSINCYLSHHALKLLKFFLNFPQSEYFEAISCCKALFAEVFLLFYAPIGVQIHTIEPFSKQPNGFGIGHPILEL